MKCWDGNNQRWAESERLTPSPDPALKTKNPDPAPKPVRLKNFDCESGSVPISAMLLHTCYIHHTIHTESGSGFSQNFKSGSESDSKNVAGLRICSAPSSVPCPSLVTMQLRNLKTGRYEKQDFKQQ